MPRTKRSVTTPSDTPDAPAPALPPGVSMPSAERDQQELATATSIEDFFGKEGIFARLFATTIEQMLESELTSHLGYAPYAADGRNSGNSCNGSRPRRLRSSAGDQIIQVPRDRNSTFQSPLLEPYQSGTNELEDKIIALYAKGVTQRVPGPRYPADAPRAVWGHRLGRDHQHRDR